MKKETILKIVVLFNFFLIIILIPKCEAYTDNPDVMGISKNTPINSIYSYLNNNNYHLLYSDHYISNHDMYTNKDCSVIFSIFNDTLDSIYLLKSDTYTDKGICVGMTADNMICKYGTVYFSADNIPDPKNDISGIGNIPDNNNYKGYVYAEYLSHSNEDLSFVINRSNNEIILIRYQTNRSGNTNVIQDIDKYSLLPYSY